LLRTRPTETSIHMKRRKRRAGTPERFTFTPIITKLLISVRLTHSTGCLPRPERCEYDIANSERRVHPRQRILQRPVDPASKPPLPALLGAGVPQFRSARHMHFSISKTGAAIFTSVVGSNSPYDYPLNTMADLEARKQGGLVVYVHPLTSPSSDVMDSNLGAKEAPLTAALGALDANRHTTFGPAAYELWYMAAELGISNRPRCRHGRLHRTARHQSNSGGARQYVDVGSEFTWNRWIDRYREGRAFVTNDRCSLLQPMASLRVRSCARTGCGSRLR